MEEKKQYSALTIDRAAFLLLRVKKAFKRKKLQRKEREKNALLAASNLNNNQRASCAGFESSSLIRKKPPPLLRSRTLPAIIIPGIILQTQLGNYDNSQIKHIKEKLPSNHSSPRGSFGKGDFDQSDLQKERKINQYEFGKIEEDSIWLKVPGSALGKIINKNVPTKTPTASTSSGLGSTSTSTTIGSTTFINESANMRKGIERRHTLNNYLMRSGSVDSLVEAVWTENDPTASSSILNEKRTSLRSEKSLALISPSVGRRLKSQRGVNELPLIHNNKSPDTEMEVASSFSLHTDLGRSIDHKSNKKEAKLFQQRLERLYKVNIHLHALFAAVENGYLERARTILESTDVDVNSLNNDGLSPLDVAVLSNNRSLVKMLFSFGAKENQRLSNSEKFGVHLKQLLNEAEVRLQELGGRLDEPYTNTRASFSSFIGNAYPSSSMTGCAGSDSDKQAIAWNRRAKILKRLVLGFTQARPPDPPSLLALDVISETSVAIRLQEPTSADSSITTKFKVQWSTKKDFSVISGEKEIYDVNKPNCIINLTQGRKYFFRASCGNLKGHGNYTLSSPNHVVPSSWKEIDGKNQRFDGQLQQLNAIMNDIKQIRPDSDIFETPAPQRKIQRKKTTIKQLFTAASKFQKNLKRGIYLACILYHEDKVLVTNEDFLPVIEIDDTFPSCIHSDLHWFMKISSTWDFIKSLKSEMEKNASSAIHFRTKLIQAALQMQSSLSLQDLGQLYFKPIKDAQGTVVLSTVNYVKSPKSISVLNSRWLPINKLYKKMVISDDQNINDLVMASIQEQINYHQASSLKLNKGLYLSYLKMQSSMDLIQIVVPSKSPNMLPHCKIRDNPHVSAEEWEYLKQQHLPDLTNRATEQQKNFLDLVTSAGKRLFNYMDIRGEDALTHRIYDLEIIEINQEVSFIVICPPAEFSCSIPGQREILLQRGDLLSLPIQVFEMIHLSTYQSSIIRKYSKLSCLLELDTVAASHMHREAFSKSEVALTKERLIRLHDLQAKLNQIWKTIRWLVDVISFARDRVLCGISMRFILNKDIESTSQTSPKRNLLQIPSRDSKIVKSTPGRGSWPGPGSNSSTLTPQNSLVNEFSKSEQHLSINDSSSQYLSACSESESRKNSDSFIEGILNERLPSSKSEDMLFALPSSSSSTTNNHHRCRAKTVSSISATSSPLLSVQPLHGGSLISVNTTNTSGSVHSINSDNDNFQQQQPPISSSTPHKVIVKSKMTPSRSMTNVKNPFTDICQPLATTTTTTTTDRYRRKLNIDFTSNLETTLSKSLSNIKSRTDTDLNYPKPVLFPTEPPPPPPPPPPVAASSSKTCDDILTKKLTTQSSLKDQSGILQVYAAYDTGLASGTSLKLHVTPRTTAKEVVDLVVKQLNMAVVLKGKDGPIYSSDKLKNFCLVTVIGARERCLRDDFKPLQLQNPWKKGRLYVRQKHDVLAALEHSSRHSAII